MTGSLLAAPTANADATATPATGSDATLAKSAEACRSDLKNFSQQMAKGGYWVADEGDSLGYPVGAAGEGIVGRAATESGIQARGPGYFSGRPGYEVRVLMAAASIVARHGQQQPCEDVLSETRELYKSYLLDLQRAGVTPVDLPGWRHRQIAAAIPVKGSNHAFRSDELLGAEVQSPDGAALGSVDDLALNPETGKLGYVVIARGGFFGFDETRIPIPWDDFKATPNADLLVLDTTKSVLDAAPHVSKNAFTVSPSADSDSQRVDAYWKANQTTKTNP
jgi:sporulation protein YlmC with PRC-barrel domain